MKEYIKQTDKERTCSHPKVVKFWEYGGGPVNGPFSHYASVHLEDGTECEFKAELNNPGNAIEQLNNFLNTIPE